MQHEVGARSRDVGRAIATRTRPCNKSPSCFACSFGPSWMPRLPCSTRERRARRCGCSAARGSRSFPTTISSRCTACGSAALCDTGDLDHALVLVRAGRRRVRRRARRAHRAGQRLRSARASSRTPAAHSSGRSRSSPAARCSTTTSARCSSGSGDEDEAEACYRRGARGRRRGATRCSRPTPRSGPCCVAPGGSRRPPRSTSAYLDEDPLNVDMLVEHGICLSDLDDFEEAVERFRHRAVVRRAITAGPGTTSRSPSFAWAAPRRRWSRCSGRTTPIAAAR